MAEYTSLDLELTEFSKQTNNVPAKNTGKLRNRFSRWKNWRRHHPYEEILDEEANREINRSEWQTESYQENPPIDEGFEEIPLEDLNVPIEDTIIEIGDVSDLTPLIEGAGVGGAGIGGSIGSTSTGTALGTVALGGGAAVIGAGVSSAINRLSSGKGFVLPGSDYIGPGNDIHIGPARSEADQVAKEHDIEYDRLSKNPFKKQKTFHEAVGESDERAIEGFDKAYQNSGELNAKLGSIGLGIKRQVEKILGFPIYPRPAKQRK